MEVNTIIEVFMSFAMTNESKCGSHALIPPSKMANRRGCQQNGKSERMIRTINNAIRSLLFQAHMAPAYWVEALHVAGTS